MGTTNHQLENYDAAIDSFKKYIKMEGESADVLSELGYAYYYKGEYDTALEYYQKC